MYFEYESTNDVGEVYLCPYTNEKIVFSSDSDYYDYNTVDDLTD